MKRFLSKVLSILKVLYRPILKVAHLIGRVNSFVLLTIFYYIFLGSARLGTLVVRKDLLDMRFKDRTSYWKQRPNFKIDRESLREPY